MTSGKATVVRVDGESNAHARPHLDTHDKFFDLHNLIVSGGDDRIQISPDTGRNEYGTTVIPSPDDVWLSSSTASAISLHGWRAVKSAQLELIANAARGRDAGANLSDATRQKLARVFDVSTNDIILSASGTDAELIVLAVAWRMFQRPITNIVISPAETGSGVMKAADGRHFRSQSCLGAKVKAGDRLSGWETANFETVAIDIRCEAGRVRHPDDVDGDVAFETERALKAGRAVLLHLLDTSKTGLPGVSRKLAQQLMLATPDRVQVVVDACQLRCPRSRVKRDIAEGFVVMTTGSKFAGGPPFSGALMLPSSVSSQLQQSALSLPGLNQYSALYDWPIGLRTSFARDLKREANIGAALRWTAALAELDRLAGVSPLIEQEIVNQFETEVCNRARQHKFVKPLADDEPGQVRTGSIVPLLTIAKTGGNLCMTDTKKLHQALRTAAPDGTVQVLRKSFHVGQTVTLGHRSALRVCLGASQIADIADLLERGRSMEVAFDQINHGLDGLFEKWALLSQH